MARCALCLGTYVYVSRKAKMTYNLESSEYLFFSYKLTAEIDWSLTNFTKPEL